MSKFANKSKSHEEDDCFQHLVENMDDEFAVEQESASRNSEDGSSSITIQPPQEDLDRAIGEEVENDFSICSSAKADPLTEADVSTEGYEVHIGMENFRSSSSSSSASTARKAFLSYVWGAIHFFTSLPRSANNSGGNDNNDISLEFFDVETPLQSDNDGSPTYEANSSETGNNMSETSFLCEDTPEPPKKIKIAKRPRKEHGFFRPIPENRYLVIAAWSIGILQLILLIGCGLDIWSRQSRQADSTFN
ncbi:hypothetical protein LSTR_LSTR009776 [Laodelphax striatellus]|uniref:Uncharacterized protein n=1 Tax=Laodelphax striatellus TaxID=195883 RepID=A0A482XMD3_LAOST|nr:hypothetical protein LSTR_LSTR009776 [Laodelphax striatellus]